MRHHERLSQARRRTPRVCPKLLIFALAAGAPLDENAAHAQPAEASSSTALDVSQLLSESDRARGGGFDGISWTVNLESMENGARRSSEYFVKARANDAYVETEQPARRKGEVMLFNDRTIWFYRPGLQSPVSLSSRQRLTGQAANGDIASTNYGRDYTPRLLGEESIVGEPTYKLELKAKANNVTYDRIVYWVSKSRRLGIKADFLTLNGSIFKTATFEYANKLATDGKEYVFVSKMTIGDAAHPANVTTIVYKNPTVKAWPLSLFNVNNLAR